MDQFAVWDAKLSLKMVWPTQYKRKIELRWMHSFSIFFSLSLIMSLPWLFIPKIFIERLLYAGQWARHWAKVRHKRPQTLPLESFPCSPSLLHALTVSALGIIWAPVRNISSQLQPRPTESESAFKQDSQAFYLDINVWEVLNNSASSTFLYSSHSVKLPLSVKDSLN